MEIPEYGCRSNERRRDELGNRTCHLFGSNYFYIPCICLLVFMPIIFNKQDSNITTTYILHYIFRKEKVLVSYLLDLNLITFDFQPGLFIMLKTYKTTFEMRQRDKLI